MFKSGQIINCMNMIVRQIKFFKVFEKAQFVNIVDYVVGKVQTVQYLFMMEIVGVRVKQLDQSDKLFFELAWSVQFPVRVLAEFVGFLGFVGGGKKTGIQFAQLLFLL